MRRGRDSDDPVVTKRLVKLADEQGLEAIAEMWAESPARSLPGALWRLYALRAATIQDPERISVYFKAARTPPRSRMWWPAPPSLPERTR